MANRLLYIGERIYHDFSGTHGIILEYRKDPQGYNYKIHWQDGKNTIDWCKRKVLRVF